MKFVWKRWYGLCIFVGFFLANCLVPTQASGQSEAEIKHRQILGSTCFYSTNAEGSVITLSCVKD